MFKFRAIGELAGGSESRQAREERPHRTGRREVARKLPTKMRTPIRVHSAGSPRSVAMLVCRGRCGCCFGDESTGKVLLLRGNVVVQLEILMYREHTAGGSPLQRLCPRHIYTCPYAGRQVTQHLVAVAPRATQPIPVEAVAQGCLPLRWDAEGRSEGSPVFCPRLSSIERSR